MTLRDHRPALNALRGFAALAIVAYHFRYYSPFPWFETFPVLSLGYLGVDFFFMLSGLVIAHVYLAGFLNGRERWGHFLFLRLSRLFPVHLLIMLALLLGALATGRAISGQQAADWISLTLLVRQWLLPENYAWNSPAWSISAEMFAYAVIFPVVVGIARHKERSSAGIYCLGFGIALLTLLVAATGSLNVIPGAGPLIRVAAGFMMGAGLYCLLSAHRPAAAWDRLIVGGSAVVPFALMTGSDVATLAALAAVTVGAYMSTGRVATFLACRLLYFLGEISFSLYLCHVPLFGALRDAADSAGIARGPLFCAGATAAALLLAAGLYVIVEVPARSALRRWWDKQFVIRAPA